MSNHTHEGIDNPHSSHGDGLPPVLFPGWTATPAVDPLYMPLAKAVADRFREGDISFKTALELLGDIPRG